MKKEKFQRSDTKLLEENVKGAPVKNVVWEGSEVETEQTRIEDSGTGKPIIMRHFDFRYPPALKGRPTKQQILTNDYKRYLNNMLWVDELELIQEPKVAFNERGFRIFAVCQPRKGSLIPGHAQGMVRPVQDYLQNKVWRK